MRGPGRGSLPVETVLRGLDDLAPCLLALAGPPSGGDDLTFRQRHIGDWIVPTVSFMSQSRSPLRLHVRGEIVNEISTNTEKKRDWKVQLAE